MFQISPASRWILWIEFLLLEITQTSHQRQICWGSQSSDGAGGRRRGRRGPAVLFNLRRICANLFPTCLDFMSQVESADRRPTAGVSVSLNAAWGHHKRREELRRHSRRPCPTGTTIKRFISAKSGQELSLRPR